MRMGCGRVLVELAFIPLCGLLCTILEVYDDLPFYGSETILMHFL